MEVQLNTMHLVATDNTSFYKYSVLTYDRWTRSSYPLYVFSTSVERAKSSTYWNYDESRNTTSLLFSENSMIQKRSFLPHLLFSFILSILSIQKSEIWRSQLAPSSPFGPSPPLLSLAHCLGGQFAIPSQQFVGRSFAWSSWLKLLFSVQMINDSSQFWFYRTMTDSLQNAVTPMWPVYWI